MNVLACDPGKSGGFALLTQRGALETWKTPQTLEELVDFAQLFSKRCWMREKNTLTYIEKVGAMPKDGRKACFTFGGWTYAQTMTLIAVAGTPILITPKAWQSHFGIYGLKFESKTAKKNYHKEVVQELYPDTKFTHYTADAALIATYARTLI